MIGKNIRNFFRIYAIEIISIGFCALGYILYVSRFYSTEILFLASFQGDVQLVGKYLGGTFVLKDLFRRFGEHGMLGYDILLLINAVLFKLSARFDLVINIFNVLVCGSFLAYCANKIAHSKNPSYFIGIALISLIMFSPMQGSSATMETQVRLGLLFFLLGAYFVSEVITKNPERGALWAAVFLIVVSIDLFGTMYSFAGLPMVFLLMLIFSIKAKTIAGKYYVLAATYFVSTCLYLYMYNLLGGGNGGLESGSVLKGMAFWVHHPLWLLKSIFAYNASAVLGESGFLALGRLKSIGIWAYLFAGALVTGIYLYSLGMFVRTKMYEKTVLPVLLQGYSFFVLILAIVGRYQYGADWRWGINNWYHVHTKLGLAACMWIITYSLSKEKPLTLMSPIKSLLTWNTGAAWVSILIVAGGLSAGVVTSLARAPYVRAWVQNIAKYMNADAADMPVDKAGNTPLLVDKATTLECLQILKKYKLSIFSSPLQTVAPCVSLTRNSRLILGSYYADGWISKKLILTMHTGTRGHFWGKIILPNAYFVPNGITVTINDCVCYANKYTVAGEYFFEANCEPNKDAVVKIQMDKSVVPKESGWAKTSGTLPPYSVNFISNNTRGIKTMKTVTRFLTPFNISIDRIIKFGLGLFCILWFAPLKNGVIAEDDIWVVTYFGDKTIGFVQHIFLNVSANRYRPVFYVFQYFESFLFGKNYQSWFYFNVLFDMVIFSALYNLMQKITKTRIIPFALSVIFITSRFSYYNITQFNGILEASCLLFLILLINFSINSWHARSEKPLKFVVLFYSLLIFTHERYFVLIGFLAALIFLADFLTPKKKAFYFAFSSTPLLLNVILKVLVFKIPFFVGTGSAQALGFNFKLACEHYFLSIINVLGINLGPAYLYPLAFDNPAMTLPYKIISLLVTFIPLLILAAHIFINMILTKDANAKIAELKKLFLAVFLTGLIILSFSITIRVEQRWLYAPSIVYIIYLGYCAGRIRKINYETKNSFINKYRNALVLFSVIFLAGLSCIMDAEYKKYINNIFFMGWRADAKTVLAATYGKYGKTLEGYDIYVIDPTPGADWSPRLNGLLSANFDIVKIHVQTVSDALKVATNKNHILTYSAVGGFSEISLKDVTDYPSDLKQAQLLTGQYVLGGGLYISKTLSAYLNTGKKGILVAQLNIPDAVRLPNGITVLVNGTIIYSHKYLALGEYSFTAKYKPNQNVVIKIMMDKAITPAALGLGADQRELSVILRDFHFE